MVGKVSIPVATGLTGGAAGSSLLASERRLAVPEALSSLLAGLARGSTISVEGDTAVRSAAFYLVSEAIKQGSWGVVAGMADPGPLAAAAFGIPLERFAFVSLQPRMAARVVAALADGIDVVIVDGWFPGEREARAVVARVRSRGSVLIALGGCPVARLRLRVAVRRWEGLGQGWGTLGARLVEATVQGRGAAERPRSKLLWMPDDQGRVREAVEPPLVMPGGASGIAG